MARAFEKFGKIALLGSGDKPTADEYGAVWAKVCFVFWHAPLAFPETLLSFPSLSLLQFFVHDCGGRGGGGEGRKCVGILISSPFFVHGVPVAVLFRGSA